MQIFLKSHTDSFSHKKKNISTRRFTQPSLTAGFTLIELLISIAIIVVITGIVLLKYTAFDSTTLLKGTAYEIALALREAQVKSLSVVRNDENTFNNSYGVTFTAGEVAGKQYTIFRYTDPSVAIPQYDVNDDINHADDFAKDISTVLLERSMYIKKVCVVTNSSDCDIDRLDVSFRRPEFVALIYATEGGIVIDNINRAQIIVASTHGGDEFTVEVTKLGQISVKSNE